MQLITARACKGLFRADRSSKSDITETGGYGRMYVCVYVWGDGHEYSYNNAHCALRVRVYLRAWRNA